MSENGTVKIMFWVMAGVLFFLIIGSYAFTATTTKAMTDNMVVNDRTREKDKDDIRNKLDNFNTVLVGKLDLIAKETSDIKANMCSYGKQIEMNCKRLDRLEK